MTSSRFSSASLTPVRAVFSAAAVIGGIDFLYPTIFALVNGRPWFRPWLNVASGLLGRETALAGGAGTVVFGLCLHFTIATGIATVYLLVSRRVALLREQTLLFGVLYGIAAFFVMNLVVIPLSRMGSPPFAWSTFTIGALLIHAALLGPAAAYFAGRVRQARDERR